MEIEELLQHPRKVWNVGKEQGLKTEWGGETYRSHNTDDDSLAEHVCG